MNASSLGQAFGWIETGSSLRLTQALVHFLWQGCAVAILYAVAARLLSRASANARYLAGVAALLAMALCLPATFLVLSPLQGAAVDTTEHPREVLTPGTISPTAVETVADRGASDLAFSSQPADAAASSPSIGPARAVSGYGSIWRSVADRVAMLTAWASPYVNSVYLCGFVLMLLRVALGSWAGRRLRCSGTPVGDGPILEMIARNARRLGIRMVPMVAYCRRVSVPVVVGVLRPMILLPASIASGLTLEQLEAVLVHELAHVRRFDPAVNVLQRLIEAMLFFHPAVWYVTRRVSAERENACDDLVLRSDCGRTQYAGALVCLAELCAAAGRRDMLDRAALAATGKHASQIKCRVLRLLGQNDDPAIRLTTTGLVTSILLILAVLLSPMAWRTVARAGEEPQAVSMSATEFARLSLAEQRALLVRVFQRRIEHARNLRYETDETVQSYENLNGEPGKPRGQGSPMRHHFRYWRLGDSYRKDTEYHLILNGAPVVDRQTIAVNGAEGIGRNASASVDKSRPPHGQVIYPHDPGIQSDRYLQWLSQVYDPPEGGNYLFPSLISRMGEVETRVLPASDLVQLSLPLKLLSPTVGNGTLTFLLDSRKGFLPVRFESRWDSLSPNGDGLPRSQIDKFVVEESRLVGDVWMPVRLTNTIALSAPANRLIVVETTATRIEHGTVTPADIRVEFTEGTKVEDLIEGVRYTCDAQGKPAGPVQLAPGWKRKPPDWWVKRYRTTESRPASGSTEPGTTQPAKSSTAFSMASRLSAEDRNMLAMERHKEEDYDRRMAALLKVLQSGPPVTLDERIDAGLEALRIYKLSGHGNERPWASVVRELIKIGKPAVPKLTAELDRTEREMTLRAVGFVLRGIGDPRAIPALIRAIPRALQPPRSDYGLRIEDDPELARFMQEHDHSHKPGAPVNRSGGFSYGRPIYEILPTLERFTGQSFGWRELRFSHLTGGVQQQSVQRRLFLKLAERWADWWSKNWQKYVKDEAEAQLDLTRQSLDRCAKSVAAASNQPRHSEFPCGVNVTVGDESHNSLIRSFDEAPDHGFLDLDSGRLPVPPDELVKSSKDHKPSKELLAWAEHEGVDLINVKITPPGTDKTFYAFQPVNMKVWRIENGRFDNLQQELRGCKKLELPSRWEGPLVQMDAASGKSDDKLTVSFLFMTKEGTCGAIQIQPPVTRTPAPGTPASPNGGLHYKFIHEGSTPD